MAARVWVTLCAHRGPAAGVYGILIVSEAINEKLNLVIQPTAHPWWGLGGEHSLTAGTDQVRGSCAGAAVQPQVLQLHFQAAAVRVSCWNEDFSWWMWPVLQHERVKLRLVFM